MYKIFTKFLLITLIGVNISIYAKNLGKIGETYPIKEMDLLDFIQTRLKQMQQSGELEKINKQITETIKKRSERLPPVKGISPAKVYRKWYVDPSVSFEHDIKDVEGKVIVKAGTVVNPLTSASLKRCYIFYDGDNKAQVAWIIKNEKQFGNSKLILVNGSVYDQSKLLKKKIYFNQHGKLTNKFKIRHTPAVITQEGLKFKVEELAL